MPGTMTVMSPTRVLAAGVRSAVVVDVGASAAVLVAANMSILTSAFLAVMVVIAVLTVGAGFVMRAKDRVGLGTGVLIGAACSVPVGFTLSLAWVVFLVFADAAFCSSSSTYWCFE